MKAHFLFGIIVLLLTSKTWSMDNNHETHRYDEYYSQVEAISTLIKDYLQCRISNDELLCEAQKPLNALKEVFGEEHLCIKQWELCLASQNEMIGSGVIKMLNGKTFCSFDITDLDITGAIDTYQDQLFHSPPVVFLATSSAGEDFFRSYMLLRKSRVFKRYVMLTDMWDTLKPLEDLIQKQSKNSDQYSLPYEMIEFSKGYKFSELVCRVFSDDIDKDNSIIAEIQDQIGLCEKQGFPDTNPYQLQDYQSLLADAYYAKGEYKKSLETLNLLTSFVRDFSNEDNRRFSTPLEHKRLDLFLDTLLLTIKIKYIYENKYDETAVLIDVFEFYIINAEGGADRFSQFFGENFTLDFYRTKFLVLNRLNRKDEAQEALAKAVEFDERLEAKRAALRQRIKEWEEQYPDAPRDGVKLLSPEAVAALEREYAVDHEDGK